MSRATKDSHIDWIGEIPDSWSTIPFRRVFEITKRIAGSTGYEVLSVTQQGIRIKDLSSNEGQMAQDYSNYQLVFPSDYVMNHMDLLTGYVDISPYAGVTSPDYRVFRARKPQEISLKYYLHIFQLCYKCRIFYHLGQGVSGLGRWRLPARQMLLFGLPQPPLSEQQAIADFLDEKCGEIDEMVLLQEKIIEELKAYKQSVITEAVCKGLNPDVPMKDSGIEGVIIPRQWSSRKFNQLCSRITDFVASGSFAALRENVPYLDTPDYAMLVRTADLSNSARSEGRVYISKQSYDFLRNSNLHGGEIVLPNIGSIGDVYIVPKDLYPKMSLAPNAITFSTLQNDKYYYYYFLGALGKKQLHDIAESTAMPKFNKTDLKQLKVLCPPINEQQIIADYLDTKCAEIDALISLKQSKIDALKEYKKSIIYEYITGKKELPYGE